MRWFLLTALTLPSLAAARPPGRPPGPPPVAHLVERHADELGIGSELAQEIAALDAASRADARVLHDAVRAAHDGLRDALDAPVIDRAAVMAHAADLAAAEERLRRHHLHTTVDVLERLTPTQRRALAALRPDKPPRR